MTPRSNPAEIRRLTLLGIDAAELYGMDSWPVEQIMAGGDTAEELVEGLILYCQLLTATLMLGRNTTPQDIAAAARESADRLLKAPAA